MSTIQIVGLAWLAASFVLAPVVGRLLKRNRELNARLASDMPTPDAAAAEFTAADKAARRRHPSGLDPL